MSELQRTNEDFTAGIVNVPLNEPLSRFLFFELDDLDTANFNIVMDVYKAYHIPVYAHRTMRGWHFLSVKRITRERHIELIHSIKYLNPKCPHVTLRIKPNKWVGEAPIWKTGFIVSEEYNLELEFFVKLLRAGKIQELKQYYKIVHYKQTGELANR